MKIPGTQISFLTGRDRKKLVRFILWVKKIHITRTNCKKGQSNLQRRQRNLVAYKCIIQSQCYMAVKAQIIKHKMLFINDLEFAYCA